MLVWRSTEDEDFDRLPEQHFRLFAALDTKSEGGENSYWINFY